MDLSYTNYKMRGGLRCTQAADAQVLVDSIFLDAIGSCRTDGNERGLREDNCW